MNLQLSVNVCKHQVSHINKKNMNSSYILVGMIDYLAGQLPGKLMLGSTEI